jgi:hypothetical protein
MGDLQKTIGENDEWIEKGLIWIKTKENSDENRKKRRNLVEIMSSMLFLVFFFSFSFLYYVSIDIKERMIKKRCYCNQSDRKILSRGYVITLVDFLINNMKLIGQKKRNIRGKKFFIYCSIGKTNSNSLSKTKKGQLVFRIAIIHR